MHRIKNKMIFDYDENMVMGFENKGEVKEQKRLASLAKKTDHSWGSGAHYSTRKGRYVRMNRTKSSSYIKNQCNRKVRRDITFTYSPRQKGIHKKMSEFWHELY